MMNALRAQGYQVTEPMIAGGGAALGFGYQEGTFPWLSARNGQMRELFFEGSGIPWQKRVPADKDAGWPEIRGLVAAGTPVVLRVDMRYLDYRYGGKFGPSYTSFGWHLITLFAIDEEAGYALVSDTEYSTLQRISLKNLQKARTSRTKVFPPNGEFYWVERAAPDYALDWERLIRESFKHVLENYESRPEASQPHSLVGIGGMARYGERLAAIESYVRPGFLLPQVLDYMAGNIEDFGTGGAAFRILYRDFLREAAARIPGKEVEKLLPPIDRCVNAWHALSGEFRSAAKSIKGARKDERELLFTAIRAAAETLYAEETAFYRELKRVYTAW